MAINTTSIAFDPAKDIPSLQGKVILVTGGNEGLGKQAVFEYAKHNPKQIWLAARNVTRAQAVVDEVHQTLPDSPVKVLKLDLTSFASIKKGAQEFVAESDRLDILMLNAGIMATAPGLTEDGYEVQFGTNHMGHALLTKLLLPTMQKTAEAADADVRVVSLSSAAHNRAPKTGGIQFEGLKTTQAELQAFYRYGQSKLGEYCVREAIGGALSAVHRHFCTSGRGANEFDQWHVWDNVLGEMVRSSRKSLLHSGFRGCKKPAMGVCCQQCSERRIL